jgi:hypothetical protein
MNGTPGGMSPRESNNWRKLSSEIAGYFLDYDSLLNGRSGPGTAQKRYFRSLSMLAGHCSTNGSDIETNAGLTEKGMIPRGLQMNDRQMLILAQQIKPALDAHPEGISLPLASAMLEIDETHLRRLEVLGLFPDRIKRADGSCGYNLMEVYRWLQDASHASR